MYQAIELQVFDVAHHSEIHNKNLPAQPGQIIVIATNGII